MSTGLDLVVYGIPAPQGSKRHVGRGVMIESSKKVGPWREAVKWEARRTIGADWTPLDGPLGLVVAFTLPRPKSAGPSRWAPDRMPDLSKLVRSTEDALTDAGVWADDARVVYCNALKVYPGTHPLALGTPGARVLVHTVAEWIR